MPQLLVRKNPAPAVSQITRRGIGIFPIVAAPLSAMIDKWAKKRIF
jgi:hypothetical protein